MRRAISWTGRWLFVMFVSVLNSLAALWLPYLIGSDSDVSPVVRSLILASIN